MADPKLIIRILGNTKQFESELNRTKKTVDKFARAGAIGITALAAGLALSVKAASDFEAVFSNVITLLDESSFKTKTLESGISDLKKGVLALRTETGESFDNLNKGLFDLISAGVDAEQAIDALRIATNLSIAGATNTSIAVDGLTSALNAFELGAEDAQSISEKFFTAQKFGKTTIEELSQGFGLVASTAAAFGVSLDELLASVAAATTGGIATKAAYTGLAAIFANITKPTSDASKEAKRLGIEFDTTALRAKGLDGFLKSITESAGFNSTTLEKMFGSVEAVKTILALTGAGADDFAKILKALGNEEQTAATFAAALAQKNDTLELSTKRLAGSIETLSVQIGDEFAPIVKDSFDSLAKNIDKNTPKIIGFIRDLTAGMATVAGIFGDLITSIFKRLLGGLQKLAADSLTVIRDTLRGAQGFALKVGIDIGGQQVVADLSGAATLLRSAAEENLEQSNFKEQLEKRLSALSEFNQQELILRSEQEDAKIQLALEGKEKAKSAGVNPDPVTATDEEFEEIIKKHKERLETIQDQRQGFADKDLETSLFVLKNKEKFADDEVKLAEAVVNEKSKFAELEVINEFAKLGQLVAGNNRAAQAFVLVAQAADIAQSIMSIQTGIAKAQELPFPANLAEMARIIALGASVVATIKGAGDISLPSFAIGSFNVPSNMTANIHKGEMILPVPFADSVRDAITGGGGGGSVAVQIDLTDRASEFVTVSQREDSKMGIQR